ncbi:hypothetical protein QUA32_07600 [Microcoleus sp. Pol14D6]|uniref:hypothetical protein n=2 Tax=unclassified Microcoleus TaxID=2642155 RepID=UPI002FD2591A
MGRLLGLKDFMRCGRSSSRASLTGDRSLCATYHILEGAYKPEIELEPIRRSTSISLLKYFSNSIDIN